MSEKFSVVPIYLLMALKSESVAISLDITEINTSTFIAFISSPWYQDSLRIVKQNVVFMSDVQNYDYELITSLLRFEEFAAVSLKACLYDGRTCLNVLSCKKLDVYQEIFILFSCV